MIVHLKWNCPAAFVGQDSSFTDKAAAEQNCFFHPKTHHCKKWNYIEKWQDFFFSFHPRAVFFSRHSDSVNNGSQGKKLHIYLYVVSHSASYFEKAQHPDFCMFRRSSHHVAWLSNTPLYVSLPLILTPAVQPGFTSLSSSQHLPASRRKCNFPQTWGRFNIKCRASSSPADRAPDSVLF